jgi:putative flavoprotein involved in K+ transport
LERHRIVVIGAGQAGLAISHELGRHGLDHVVLERAQIGQGWRNRWDSFCLVTPNWTVQLPGQPYAGGDPDGYLLREEIVSYLADYAAAAMVPVREGVDVLEVRRLADGNADGTFELSTTAGRFLAETVVVCTGAYQAAFRPTGAASMPAAVLQLDSGDYRNAAALPPGDVLVVGSGQSGCQLAEEILESGRRVTLACGRAGWAPRRIGGRDVIWWTIATGFLDEPVGALPSPRARLTGNLQGTGHHGGRDLHLRSLQEMGATLAGHFLGVSNGRASFAPDLAATVAWGDERRRQFIAAVRAVVKEQGLPEPEIDEPRPFTDEGPTAIDLSSVGTMIFAGGYRPAYGHLLPWPEAFDELGFPIQTDGRSTVVDGLYFVGVHYLRKRKSSLLYGVGEDAAIVAEAIAGRGSRGARPG